VAIALDRQEKATEAGQDVPWSAVQYVREKLGLQVCAIANLADLCNTWRCTPATNWARIMQRCWPTASATAPVNEEQHGGRIGWPVRFRGLDCLLAGSGAWAAEGIYTCVDAKGRRLTSDRRSPNARPRAEASQPSGTVRRTIVPRR
jgi:hypothetical protein